MKQIINRNEIVMNSEVSRKQLMKKKKAEANARREVNKRWKKIEHSSRYRSISAKEVCDTITKKIETEMLDGIFLNLNTKNQKKSVNVQNRILRRIAEKRQAQANHKKYGHMENRFSIHVSIASTSNCMKVIRKKRFVV